MGKMTIVAAVIATGLVNSGATATAADPVVTMLTQPLVLKGFQDGAVFDLMNQTLIAAKPMASVVIIDGTQNPNGQTFSVVIKLGIVNANGLATNGIRVTGLQDSRLEVSSVVNAASDGFYAFTSGKAGLFNNKIVIGSLRNNGGNGGVFASPDNGVIGVQGMNLEIGQIIANRGNGIHLQGYATAFNHLTVGPVEHNGGYGCLDPWMNQPVNKWVVINSNSNAKSNATC